MKCIIIHPIVFPRRFQTGLIADVCAWSNVFKADDGGNAAIKKGASTTDNEDYGWGKMDDAKMWKWAHS